MLTMEDTSMEVNVREYLKHEFTPQEIAERIAFMEDWDKRLEQANKESPLPDDIMNTVDPPNRHMAVAQ
jgi:hypothetical protein